MNHKFTDGRQKTVLLGFNYLDDRNGQLYMQDRAAWIKRQGSGRIISFKPGHATAEFRNPRYARMVLNAVQWDGKR